LCESEIPKANVSKNASFEDASLERNPYFPASDFMESSAEQEDIRHLENDFGFPFGTMTGVISQSREGIPSAPLTDREAEKSELAAMHGAKTDMLPWRTPRFRLCKDAFDARMVCARPDGTGWITIEGKHTSSPGLYCALYLVPVASNPGGIVLARSGVIRIVHPVVRPGRTISPTPPVDERLLRMAASGNSLDQGLFLD